jgi:deaminated glutathione amidase
MIIDPWGKVLAECPDGEGFCVADIDLAFLAEVRQRMPVLEHRRPQLYTQQLPKL